ncbi:MAG: hypothetical protein CL916_06230 [Deltaproteobacteria bacterium]|nr:hypothetical protein [Deltaproteobacteria bacterium]
MISLSWLASLSLSAHAEPLQQQTMVTIAASLVEMASQDGVINDKERTLLATKFPLKEQVDPVLVFTLDRSNLPEIMGTLDISTQQKEGFLHFMGLIALVDGQITNQEKKYFMQHKAVFPDPKIQNSDIQEYFMQSQKILNRIQHEPMLETMRELAKAQKKYHKIHKRYLSTKICPQQTASSTISWKECKAQFANFPWVAPDSVQGSYKMEGTKNAFVITGTIDIDGDGVSATYVSTHTAPSPKRIGNPNAD